MVCCCADRRAAHTPAVSLEVKPAAHGSCSAACCFLSAGAGCSIPSGFCPLYASDGAAAWAALAASATSAPAATAAQAPVAAPATEQRASCVSAAGELFASQSEGCLQGWRGRHALCRSQLSSARCCCFASPPSLPSHADCTERQRFNRATQSCECLPGWGGIACEACQTDAACAALPSADSDTCSAGFVYSQQSRLKIYSCALRVSEPRARPPAVGVPSCSRRPAGGARLGALSAAHLPCRRRPPCSPTNRPTHSRPAWRLCCVRTSR